IDRHRSGGPDRPSPARQAFVPPLRVQGPRVGLSAMVIRFGLRTAPSRQKRVQAAKPPSCPLNKRETSFLQAIRTAPISVSVVFRPMLNRTAPAASAGATPMALSTCEAVTLPDEQAAPDEAAIPARSRAIRAVSAFWPGTANKVVLGSR